MFLTRSDNQLVDDEFEEEFIFSIMTIDVIKLS